MTFFVSKLMAPSTLLCNLVILLAVLPKCTRGDEGVPPVLAPFFDNLCDEVECGKGKCVVDTSYPLNFYCECEPGWKRTRDNNTDTHLTGFLPCTIPNCTLDYSCQPPPPPVPAKEVPFNLSFFDPCYWMYCGEGKCTKNKTYTHTCECNQGYNNLLNITAFPCYSECTLGTDCSKLGIQVAKSTTTTTNQDGEARSILPGNFLWIFILISVGLVGWK